MSIESLKAQVARLSAQLEKKNAGKGGAEVVDEVVPGIGSASISTTEDAREALNQQDGVDLVGSGEEVRQDMSTADRSDRNPVDKPATLRGRKGA